MLINEISCAEFLFKVKFKVQGVIMLNEQKWKEFILARDNYSFSKRQKELAKKKKKEEKKQSKLDKKNIQSNADSEQTLD